MSPEEAAHAVRHGAVVKMTVGIDPDDPVLLVFADDLHEDIWAHAIHGWSAGVTECVCEFRSSFLTEFLDVHALAVVDRPEGLQEGQL